MPETPQFKNPKEEIEYLTKKVAEKKEALERSRRKETEQTERKPESLESMNEKTSKEAVRTVLEAHIENATPSSRALPVDDVLKDFDDHKKQITELVKIAFSRGIMEAVRVARALENPHLLDEFHDVLVDRFYERLVAEDKIKK